MRYNLNRERRHKYECVKVRLHKRASNLNSKTRIQNGLREV